MLPKTSEPWFRGIYCLTSQTLLQSFFISETLAMTEPTPSSHPTFSNLLSEFDNLPVPSMDPIFFCHNDHAMASEAFAFDHDLPMEFGNDSEFQISFDDLDDLYIPQETDDFLLPDVYNQPPELHDIKLNDDAKQLSYNMDSDTPGLGNQMSNVAKFLKSQSSESSSSKQELSVTHSADNLGDQNSHQLPDSDSFEQESFGGPVSSQGSGNGGSGDSCVHEVVNSLSPSSDCDDDRDISSHGIADQNVNLKEMGKSCDLKRKKQQDEGNIGARITKYRKSSMPMENTTQQSSLTAVDEDDEKRKARLMRNRESAQLSRQRKKHYVEELEEKLRSMHSNIADLSSKISFVMTENATLRQQLSASGMCPPPAPGMYMHPPMAPMTYPWVPYAPYVVKQQGSQVPVVPIPRLKSQQSRSHPNAKKSDNKKTHEGKTKKVASFSFLGLFFFIFLFGGLVPLVNFKFTDYGGNVPGSPISITDRFYSKHVGKVWEVIGRRKGSEGDEGVGFSDENLGVSNRIIYEKGHKLEETHKQRHSPYRTGSDDFVHRGNASEPEPLLASLYVPRNDKLVKIDGNLIIHSVMATEKAMASQKAHKEKNWRETGLAISRDWDSALAILEVGRNRDLHPHSYMSSPEQRKALASSSTEALKDHLKSTATDGNMQKWFREGLAGPMLSSGLCSEVFRFDASPKPGAIVPASPLTNVSAVNHQNDSSINKSRNRRFLHRLPRSLARSGSNISEEHVARNSQNEDLHGNKAMSSMVVSVLVDPKEVGDGDAGGMMNHKSLSRIFVVVLIDSVKYVTYSCGLPRASPHLVTASG